MVVSWLCSWLLNGCAVSGVSWSERLSPSPSSDACSWRSGTPSPPLSEPGSCYWAQGTTDEGIVIDHFDDIPKKKKVSVLFLRTLRL
ncbi:hypothetical protein ONE63_006884 [Megalurothrips usitatus]|uniref:Secreted protein n=1 Tax=Megalurothrips usitatus TaxID=439358 RepID=A0AAV7XTM0_9NEOP|nr:hypothetical protein ONE63_006884 [Megalurothrips usitatus]